MKTPCLEMGETGKSSYFEITPLSPPLEMGETENPVPSS